MTKRTQRHWAPIVALVLVLVCVAKSQAAEAPAAPAVSNVVVQFEDGTQQKLVAPPTTAPTTGPTTPPPATNPAPIPHRDARPFLGVNLEAIRDYDRQFMFIDAIKTSRRWGTTEKPYDTKGPVGPDGWPSGDAGTAVMVEQKNINGIYRFSATGRCDLTTPGSPAKVENLRYDAARNRTTADVVVRGAQDKPITLNLVFRGTDGGLKDIKLLRPGYSSDEQLFTGEFLNALRPFDAIRFMDFFRTNNSLVSTWADRTTLASPQWTVPAGGPYEVAIELGNRLDKDVWLTVPHLADDEFVRQLGNLLRERLKPGVRAYVEYSNEVWNGQFQQAKWNAQRAKDEVAAGETTLNDNGADKNVYRWAWRRVAKRTVEIKRLLGDDPHGQFRVVLASQVNYAPPGTLLKTQLEYIEKYHGPPGQFLYAIAAAPYFSPGKDELDPAKKKWFTERADVTVDALCDRLLARTATAASDNVKAFHALARKHGLKSFGYEGGLDMQQFGNALPVKVASQYDLRAGQAVENYLDTWYAGGGDAMFYFTLSCKYSKTGYWGLTEDVRELLTPKYLAAARVAAKLRAAQPAR